MNKCVAAVMLAGACVGAQAANVIQASFKTCDKPVWPAEALRNDYQGTVSLAMMIDVDGDVQETRIEKSSGYAVLDQAAAAALARCKFSPRKINGRPAPSLGKLDYVWSAVDISPAEIATTLAEARAGAARGEAGSQYRLGLLYLRGQGVTRDLTEGRQWLRLAAEQGHANAQGELGAQLIPAEGQPGDPAQALGWFRKAAAQGHARSQYFLGAVLLTQGETDEALSWLHKSAEQNFPAAQAKLASLQKAGGG